MTMHNNTDFLGLSPSAQAAADDVLSSDSKKKSDVHVPSPQVGRETSSKDEPSHAVRTADEGDKASPPTIVSGTGEDGLVATYMKKAALEMWRQPLQASDRREINELTADCRLRVRPALYGEKLAGPRCELSSVATAQLGSLQQMMENRQAVARMQDVALERERRAQSYLHLVQECCERGHGTAVSHLLGRLLLTRYTGDPWEATGRIEPLVVEFVAEDLIYTDDVRGDVAAWMRPDFATHRERPFELPSEVVRNGWTELWSIILSTDHDSLVLFHGGEVHPDLVPQVRIFQPGARDDAARDVWRAHATGLYQWLLARGDHSASVTKDAFWHGLLHLGWCLGAAAERKEGEVGILELDDEDRGAATYVERDYDMLPDDEYEEGVQQTTMFRERLNSWVGLREYRAALRRETDALDWLGAEGDLTGEVERLVSDRDDRRHTKRELHDVWCGHRETELPCGKSDSDRKWVWLGDLRWWGFHRESAGVDVRHSCPLPHVLYAYVRGLVDMGERRSFGLVAMPVGDDTFRSLFTRSFVAAQLMYDRYCGATGAPLQSVGAGWCDYFGWTAFDGDQVEQHKCLLIESEPGALSWGGTFRLGALVQAPNSMCAWQAGARGFLPGAARLAPMLMELLQMPWRGSKPPTLAEKECGDDGDQYWWRVDEWASEWEAHSVNFGEDVRRVGAMAGCLIVRLERRDVNWRVQVAPYGGMHGGGVPRRDVLWTGNYLAPRMGTFGRWNVYVAGPAQPPPQMVTTFGNVYAPRARGRQRHDAALDGLQQLQALRRFRPVQGL